MEQYTGLEIAVIGLSGRFPKANTIEQYWENLKNGLDCISEFSMADALAGGEREEVAANPLYIRSHGFLEHKDHFDAAFFGYRPDEAELTDPQIRIFHECCWEALEDSGYDISRYKGKVGLFAGGTANFNWEAYAQLKNNDGLVDNFTATRLRKIAYLCSRVSYRLNLKGPSVFVQTGCSTSLVSIHTAVNSLLLGECSMALAGGITVTNYSKKGYLYEKGLILSRDGKCRPFDADSSGTVASEGAGVVVLKRLKDAIRDRDHIYAVIKGTGINNDGNDKVGYTAPGVTGQAEAIRMAHNMARIDVRSIGYIETHGTATELGDPIEIAALHEAFGRSDAPYCAIGSVKSNLGHADCAAGVAGFIKAVLSIKNRQIPASLHYNKPNPKIDFNNSPFYVNNVLQDWKSTGGPLRAGVSSFGIGGTNAHVVLEEAPVTAASTAGRPHQLILLSAKTEAGLERNAAQLLGYLRKDSTTSLPDIAYTLQNGRTRFKYRKMFVCESHAEAENILAGKGAMERTTADVQEELQHIVFMFSGQGAQYTNMCRELYLAERMFREKVDECLRIAALHSQEDFYTVLFPGHSGNETMINQTRYTQPLLFIIEYSLAWLLMQWGIRPHYMIGHSIGEYVAACISGVFSLNDALKLVIRRGEMMGRLEKGSMLSVQMNEAQLKPWLIEHPGIDLAVINSVKSLVVAGREADIIKLQNDLINGGQSCRVIHTSHAFHSHMMDEILPLFEKVVEEVKIHEPQIPYISNVTGELTSFEEIRQPSYWSRHLRSTVQFERGAETLLKLGRTCFVEIGPGRSLCNNITESNEYRNGHDVINTVRQSKQSINDQRYLVEKLGLLWLKGITIDWDGFYKNEKRNRISLPAYSFEKVSYTADVDAFRMIQGQLQTTVAEVSQPTPARLQDYINISNWQLSVAPNSASELKAAKFNFMVFADDTGFSDHLIKYLEAADQHVIKIIPGNKTREKNFQQWEIDLSDQGALWASIEQAGMVIHHILYCSALTADAGTADYEQIDEKLHTGYLGLSYLAKSLAQLKQTDNIELTVVNNYLAKVTGTDRVDPLKAAVLGPAKIIPLEISHVSCKVIDIPYPLTNKDDINDCLHRLINEVFYTGADPLVAYRYAERWVQSFQPLPENDKLRSGVAIAANGTYIVAGGFGGMGFTLAIDLAKEHHANVIIVHRSPFPPREEWNNWLLLKGDADAASQKIRQIIELENTGRSIHLYRADVANEEQVQEIMSDINQRHPVVNGLIWAAGEVDYGGIIQNRKAADLTRYVSSKIHGLLLFKKYLNFQALDFLALFSSIGNVLYQNKFGQVAYNAANEFLESFAQYAKQELGIHVFTINWRDWLDVGMTVKTIGRREKINDTRLINAEISDGISPETGVAIFHNCLRSKVPVSTIFKGDLTAAIRSYRTRFTEMREKLNGASLASARTEERKEEPEEKLTAIFSRFFGTEDIGADTDFFEMGGDSLKGMTMVARINQHTGARLTIGDLYQYPTIRQLSALLTGHGTNAAGIHIPVAAKRPHYALSSAQKRLYFLQTLDKSSTVYNEPKILLIKGTPDNGKLKHAFAQLIDRHESLRTSFVVRDETPCQVIHDSVDFRIEYYHCDENETNAVIRSFIRPFDLAQAPLLRAAILEKLQGEKLLMIDLHHIVADGVSKAILIRDFTRFYSGDTLPALTLQYKDYSEWQQGNERQPLITQQKEFWIKEFAEPLKVPGLPTSYPRPLIKNYEGNTLTFYLNNTEATGLKAIADAGGASLFMVILAVYNVWLSKLTGQEDLVIGTPVAGRLHADLENVVGVFINSLAMRNNAGGQMTFMEFLADVKARSLACFNNQEYPYEELVQALNIERDGRNNPLFDVMFNFRAFDNSTTEKGEVQFEAYGHEQSKSRLDLTLYAIETADGIDCSFEYSTALFDQRTISHFISCFRQIVQAVINDRAVIIAGISIVTAEERHQLLYDFNTTQADYPEHSTVVALFEKQVAKSPEAIAFYYKDKHVSYRELDELSGKMATYLQDIAGVNTGDRVALLLKRDEYLLPSILGVLRSGAAYIPVDPDYPANRVGAIIEEAGCKVLLTSGQQRIKITEAQPVVVDLAQCWETIVACEARPSKQTASDALAYIIYTSGSTGSPKGVMITHRSLVNYISWGASFYTSAEPVTFPLFTSISFDLTITSVYVPLVTGNSIVLYEENGKDLLVENVFNDNRCDIIKLTPSHLKVIRDNECISPAGSNRVRKLIVGGEDLETNLARSIYDKFGGQVIIYNEYGPTETTVGCMIYEYNPEDKEHSVPIGRPINNTMIYLLDKHLAPLPIGVTGELYVSGDGVGRGYWANDALTAERFINNPFVPGQRMYKTGDLVRMLPDGRILYKGRTDEQVKIRGYRIELAEIVSCLMNYTGITEAVVLAKERNGDKFLVAWYAANKEMEEDTLRKYVVDKLPAYMVPAAFVHVQKFPLTSNGKLDRKALPDPESRTKTGTHYAAPANEAEEKLVKIWSQVLKMDEQKISVSRSFLELGGNSLLIVLMLNKVLKEFNVMVPINAAFSHPDIRSLSRHIQELDRTTYSPVKKAPPQSYYRLSSAQKRLYFLYKLDEKSTAYNMPNVLRLEGTLDKQRLIYTFRELVNRHESLRTCFELINEEPVQKIMPDAGFEIAILQAGNKEVPDLVKDFVRPFDPGKAPLIRVALLELGEREHLLLVDMHHIITDGVSQAVLIKDFMALYKNEVLPELQLQYKDYAEWQQGEEQQRKTARQKEFWINEFTGELPRLELATDFPRPLIKTTAGNSLRFQIAGERAMALKSIAEAEGTTMFMVLLSVWNILLAKLSGQDTIVVGIPVAGRHHADLENIIGMFVNTLPVRNTLSGDWSFTQFLHAVKSKTLACFENQSCQYEVLIEELKVERDISRNPLFDVLFVFQNFEEAGLSIPGLQVERYNHGNGISKFDLTLTAAEKDGGIYLNVEYATALFRKATIERFIACLQEIVSVIINDPDVRLKDIDIVPAEEKHLLLHEFNNTSIVYDRQETIVSLFEKQVMKTPHATAVLFGDEKMSYEQLNDKANAIAYAIAGNTVITQRKPVGLLFHPSIEMVAAMLGVLKAGCAYVPLSPEGSAIRNRHILKDCDAELLLVQAAISREKAFGELMEERQLVVESGTVTPTPFNPARRVAADDIMYVIYTSGSTGQPKGVAVKHAGLVNMVNFYRQLFHMQEAMKVSQVANISFDASAFEIWPCLTLGGCLHIAPASLRFDPGAMREWLIKTGIEISFQPPAIAEYLLREEWTGTKCNLKVMNIAGDQLNYFPATALPFKLYNLYGPTEDSVWTTYTELRYDQPRENYLIGKPIPNKKVLILNKEHRLVPVGVPGELCITGIGLAGGYVNNEELTREKFIESPALPGVRVYRTGDLARWLPDGNLEFLGRIDNQLKIRGHRIEPGEIEHHLLAYNGIRETLVVVREQENNKHLVAYYVAGETIDVPRLRDFLAARLPGYMVPSYYMQLQKFPLTLSGKPDRKSLPEPVIMAIGNHAPPLNEVEEKLAEIWSEVLNIEKEKIGINSNFFELGGHSMDIIKLNNKINKQFKCHLTVPDMFRLSTIASLEAFIVKGDQGVEQITSAIDQALYEANEHLRMLEDLDQDHK